MIKSSLRVLATASALAFLAVAGVTSSQAQGQSPIFFDDFLLDNSSQPGNNVRGLGEGVPTAQTFLLWTVSNPGSVDLVGGNLPVGDPAQGGRFVDLGGSTGVPALFQTAQEITLLPNVSYTLSFRYLSTAAFNLGTVDPSTNTARVTLGGQSFTFSSSSPTFQQYSRDFVFPAGTTTRLAFQDLGPADNSGVGIDMVMITPTVPEPGSMVLLLLGGLVAVGAGGWARRLGTR